MRLGPYRIIQPPLGHGTIATVFLGIDRNRNKFAIKQLNPFLSDQKSIDLLIREAKINRNLSSRHIVEIYDYKKLQLNNTNYHCLILEYVDGINLAKHIEYKKHLTCEEVVRISWQICQGLIEAHSKGTIHRDLKPQNIIISKNGTVKITDFGLASAVSQSIATFSRAPGTPLYMSPEQADDKNADGRSDLYSLGAIMYEMLVGQPPFQGSSTSVILKQHIESQPIPLTSLRSDIPPRLTILVHRMLKKNPDHRPQTAEETSKILVEIAESMSIDLSSIKDQTVPVKIKSSARQQFRDFVKVSSQ